MGVAEQVTLRRIGWRDTPPAIPDVPLPEDVTLAAEVGDGPPPLTPASPSLPSWAKGLGHMLLVLAGGIGSAAGGGWLARWLLCEGIGVALIPMLVAGAGSAASEAAAQKWIDGEENLKLGAIIATGLLNGITGGANSLVTASRTLIEVPKSGLLQALTRASAFLTAVDTAGARGVAQRLIVNAGQGVAYRGTAAAFDDDPILASVDPFYLLMDIAGGELMFRGIGKLFGHLKPELGADTAAANRAYLKRQAREVIRGTPEDLELIASSDGPAVLQLLSPAERSSLARRIIAELDAEQNREPVMLRIRALAKLALQLDDADLSDTGTALLAGVRRAYDSRRSEGDYAFFIVKETAVALVRRGAASEGRRLLGGLEQFQLHSYQRQHLIFGYTDIAEFDEAIRVALAAEYPHDTVAWLLHIAERQRKLGRVDDSIATLQSALSVPPRNPDRSFHDRVRVELCRAYLSRGEFQQALEQADQIVELRIRSDLLEDVVYRTGLPTDRKEPFEVLLHRTRGELGEEIQAGLKALERREAWEAAEAARQKLEQDTGRPATIVEDPDGRLGVMPADEVPLPSGVTLKQHQELGALADLVEGLLKEGRVEEALLIARRTEPAFYRGSFLWIIAATLARDPDRVDLTRALLQEARGVAVDIPSADLTQHVLGRISSVEEWLQRTTNQPPTSS